MVKHRYAILNKYLPKEFVPIVADLLDEYPVKFKIVKPRKTKLGDFKFDPKSSEYQITINGDLNPYSFLITTLHEFAHLICHKNHGNKVPPHGKEWKNHFNEILQPIIHSEHTPVDIRRALHKSVHKIKASSCTDIELNRALASLDPDDGTVTLEKLAPDTTFLLNGRTFRKGSLRRTRYLCMEPETGKQYLINKLSKVELIERGE
ncbi:MAG: SprT-like domain-containing protein [Crocinitomicaceae bacterium]